MELMPGDDMRNGEAYKGANRCGQIRSRHKDRPGFLRARAMTHLKAFRGLCLCWLTMTGAAHAQQAERPASPIPNLDYAYSNLPTQPVGPNDLLALSVYDSPELTRSVRVDEDGNIRLPMLKDPIQVRGLVPSQVEVAVARALTKGK